jgi:hypothetical protein
MLPRDERPPDFRNALQEITTVGHEVQDGHASVAAATFWTGSLFTLSRSASDAAFKHDQQQNRSPHASACCDELRGHLVRLAGWALAAIAWCDETTTRREREWSRPTPDKGPDATTR